MPTKHHVLDELEAFCHSCPDPQEVITFLKQLGLRLDFQMEAFLPPVYSPLAELPAQFHFADDSGMSLIYLAGEDSATEDGERLPVAQEPLLVLCWRRYSAFRTDHTARGCAVVIHLALSIASTAGCRVTRRRDRGRKIYTSSACVASA